MKVKLVTDSTANLPINYVTENQISVVSLYYILNGVEYPAFDKANENLLKDFYSELRKKPKISTSCSNEDNYYDVFKQAVEEGNEILYIGLSSGVSATFSSALSAKNRILNEYEDAKIYCLDSLSGSYGQGRLVIKAVDLIKKGKSAKECYDLFLKERYNFSTYVTVDDMYCLYQGGRIPSLAYKIGSLVNIKPILKVNGDGKLVSHSKVLSRNQSISGLFNVIKKNISSNKDAIVYVTHGDCEKEANSLAEKIKRELNVKEVVVDLLEAIIGAHAGAGALAIFFPSENKD